MSIHFSFLVAIVLAAIGTFTVTPIIAQQLTVEASTDRYGSDYASSILSHPNPELCRTQCENDTRCKAYTYVKPGVQGSEARCYLKDPVPTPTTNDCCISGVKQASTITGVLNGKILPGLSKPKPIPGLNNTVPRGLSSKAKKHVKFGDRNALGFGWPVGGTTQPQQQLQPGIGQSRQPLSVKRDLVWDNPIIGVCWEDVSAFATERGWVREATLATWEAESKVRFIGWNACPANFNGIRIQIADVNPHTKGLGKELRNKRNGMVLNFTFESWSSNCQTSREFCIKAIAVHEFGHALGAGHEQNRNDVLDQSCRDQRQGPDPDYNVTPYDIDSIMNYCNPSWNGNGRLSAWDIEGIRALYGWNRSASYEAPGVGHLGQGAGAAIADINGNGIPDLILMAIDSPSGENTARYRIGFDLDTQGKAARWSDMFVSPGMGHESQGGGAAIADLNGNGRSDLVLLSYDNPKGKNNFRYRIAWDLNQNGAPSRWSDLKQTDGAGDLGEGAGADFADLNSNGIPDLFVMAYDAPNGSNSFRYKVGFDLNANGNAASWSGVTQIEGVGHLGEGAGLAAADIDHDGWLDLVLVAYDAPDGNNNFRYIVFFDVMAP